MASKPRRTHGIRLQAQIKHKPPSGGFFAIVNNEKKRLKNNDKTKKTRIFG